MSIFDAYCPPLRRSWSGAAVLLAALVLSAPAGANVTAISDGSGGGASRTLSWDGLDRLTQAGGLWGNASYGYNAAGDPVSRNGSGYTWDAAHRLRAIASLASYGYDGHGRRIRETPQGGTTRYPVYDRDGRRLYTRGPNGEQRRYVLAGPLLVAEDLYPASGSSSRQYLHSDALGSLIARSNSAGTRLTRHDYGPWGESVGATPDGPGYTGHESDPDSGLVYAQQRYYDPRIGRFLTPDPVAADAGTGANFNRYGYAKNNPYRYVDPDGRFADVILDLGFIAYSAHTLVTGPSWTNAAALGADVVGAVVPFATGLGAAVRAANHGIDAAKASDSVAREITLTTGQHGEAAQHAADAIRAGKPDVLTIDRAGASANRQESIGGLDKVPGQHLDEYPPAMFKEGGSGASVRPINPRDNMSAGACIGNACRGLADGERVRIKVEDK
ncbi:MAG: hypothetical protein EPO25_04735 [Gammaproteobacteria bacterium]|nr:MAG: hypothetical protein EPO25_04735 [Gammaproteobacteria bacterium]